MTTSQRRGPRTSLAVSLLLAGAVALTTLAGPADLAGQSAQLESWKSQLVSYVQDRRGFTADMVDQIFSYGELGFQEFETSRYLVDLLREEGFTVEEGVAGIPTAWVATWGSGDMFQLV